VFEDAVKEASPDMLPNSNDTNEDDLYYFARVKNHYLHLVKPTTSSLDTRHEMKYLIIVDSSANYHMFKECEFFETLHRLTGQVILGDGKTMLTIQGIGTVRCLIGNEMLIIENVRYVPELAESMYSLFLHIKQPQHEVESSFDSGLHLHFPLFTNKAIVGHDDIYLDIVSHPDNSTSTTSFNAGTDSSILPTAFCRKVKEFHESAHEESRIWIIY